MRRADRATYRGLRDALDEMPPREGFIEVYKQILELGLPTAIGSLTETQDARIILEKSGLDQLFDSQRIILKEDVTNVKPAPEVYQRTAERMGVNPRRQLVFEDSHHGVSAARDAGSVVYGVPTIDQPSVIIRLREAGAIQVATNWNDVRRELFGPEGRPASTQSRGRR